MTGPWFIVHILNAYYTLFFMSVSLKSIFSLQLLGLNQKYIIIFTKVINLTKIL
jgi:hypothetical protein